MLKVGLYLLLILILKTNMTIQAETNNMLLFNSKFLDYIKTAENEKLKKFGTKMIHDDGAGNKTIGYGHKLTQNEIETNKVYGYDINNLTKNQANDILIRDLKARDQLLKNRLGKDYTNLDTKRKQMLIDIEFNVGNAPGIFPNFTKGVLENNINTMKKEYKRKFTDRKGNTKPLTRRNELFSNFFFGKN